MPIGSSKTETWSTRECTTEDLRAGRADAIDLAYAATHIDNLEDVNAALHAALVDCVAMLRHYVEGRPRNWDGSTEGQARSCIRDARAAIEKAKGVA
jgi:hypothetical protein